MKKKMALLNSAIVVVSFAVAFLLCAVQVHNQYEQEFTRRLDAVLSLSSLDTAEISENPQKEAKLLGDSLQKSGQAVRISIIAENGRVLGDSAQQDINENHLQRPEIQEALKNGRGYDMRLSETTHQRYLYAAQRVDGKYLVRAALRTTEMDNVMRGLVGGASICMLIGILVACLATLPLVSRMLHPLQEPDRCGRGDQPRALYQPCCGKGCQRRSWSFGTFL